MSATCTMPGCTLALLARGYCSKHYAKWRKYGDASHVVTASPGEPFAFLQKAHAEAGNKCIDWPYSSYSNGYGNLHYRGQLTGAHRVSCRLAYGEPPSALHHAAHSCGNRKCINPKHLRWAIPSENEADKVKMGRDAVGQRNGMAKLTPYEVLRIYKLKGAKPQEQIAEMFDVCRRTIGNIHSGKNWSTVTGKTTP